MFNYLFFINEEKISVFHYDSKNKKNPFKAEKNKGETEFSIKEENFWNWWKETVSYTEGDTIDFCFIYDCQNEIINHDFIYNYNNSNKNKTIWTIEKLNTFFKRVEIMKKYSSISIITDNGICIELGKHLDFSHKQFYTNICYEPEKIEQQQCYEKEISVMAQYYREKLIQDARR